MTQSQAALTILESARGAVPLAVFKEAGVYPETLRRLVEAGRVERPASGHYALAGRIDILDIDWVAFSLQVPEGVIGLLTAAVHHEMTQELPSYLQAFIPRSRQGRLTLGGDSGAMVDVVTSRNPLHLTEGVVVVEKSGVPVKVTSKERTLVDMFLYSPFNSGRTDRSARIPEETFLDSLSRCVDDPDFSFDAFNVLAEAFGCDDQVRPFTKTSRYVAPRPSGP
ncbi:type IV toxin-antitoxin system AbiEi family antitoxin domain-containing protein [Pararhizobium sp. BT-229]|uniref:type IV toxin-antitoxin system AbiEi family antitoxin domain-containing protein n=1 Tax=Pararhizobium sp. BT-229 TaxID=2986923 RepID=UPI003559232E